MDNLESKIEEQAKRIKPMVCAKVNRQDVNDVMQDIRLSFFIAFPQFEGNSKLSTYAHIIAKRRIADYYKKKAKTNEQNKRLERELMGKKVAEQEARGKPGIEINPPDWGCCTLTKSQKIVLRLVGEGLSNEEIAKTLYISITTIRAHMRMIYKKLQYRSRVKLALFSYKFFKEKTNGT